MIEVIGLTKRFGSTTAVDDLSFTVRPGQVTGFLGPNGAGKSTTLRMIVGLDRPDAGAALVGGRLYRELRYPLRSVGTLLDARAVHPSRSARSHLRWLARSNRIGRRRVAEVLDLVGLTAVAGKRAGGYSLGMSQRLGIAAALLGDPPVLLFDEPVNGLDPEGVQWIRELLRRLAEEGRTVLVSSHLLTEMAQTADELVVIGRGTLIAQCGSTEFVERAGTAAVLVRTPQPDRLAAVLGRQGVQVRREPAPARRDALIVTGAGMERVGELAAANGVVLHELSARQGSLESAFMRLTSDAVEYRQRAKPGAPTASDDLIRAGQ